jgi:hypothetical protein
VKASHTPLLTRRFWAKQSQAVSIPA